MTTSNTTSPDLLLRLSRLDRSRVECPFPARALDLFLTMLLWPNEQDRTLLRHNQRVAHFRERSGDPPLWQYNHKFRPWPAALLFEAAFRLIVEHDHLHRQAQAWLRFAVAAENELRKYGVTKSFGLGAVYQELVMGENDMYYDDAPMELREYVGQLHIHEALARDVDWAEGMASECVAEIARRFPQDCKTPVLQAISPEAL